MNEQVIKLREEIIEDAKAKAERIVARAKNDADAVISKARAASKARHEERMDEAKAIADKQYKAIVSSIDMEVTRRWLLCQEACIDKVLKEALDTAEAVSGEARVASLTSLAREAMAAIGNVGCTVRVSEKDAGLVTSAWLSQQAQALFGADATADFQVTIDNTLDGGLVFTSNDGKKSFDNSYACRLARMHDELRLLLVNGK